ncbi:MAG: SAM-dependent DNA methyltransferase [Promethearchaeota archaeon]|nr:MAG: SAM-dependent DNA methyltransferase [Candidatus Lokiarchaeota archaeon]
MTNNNSLFKASEKSKRRALGAHMTSIDIFTEFIHPRIKDSFKEFIWVDLYAGEGNLILPILSNINPNEREEFFKKNMYLFDVQNQMVNKCIKNAESYGISRSVARKNIQAHDSLDSFPKFLKTLKKPIYHITNPPYLYLGYISKHESTRKYLQYFKGNNSFCQDLYQIAMMKDLENELDYLIYIIPSNFLYGASVSNNFRLKFLKYYKIIKAIIFETKMFRFTGTNIIIGFFQRKAKPRHSLSRFTGIKLSPNNHITKKKYILNPKFKYRAGSEFQAFLSKFKATETLKVRYYLLANEINENSGSKKVTLLDANRYKGGDYERKTFYINLNLYKKISKNILYVRTVDTGSNDGRVGLNFIREDFNVDGILVSGNTYRTHPIQIFLKPEITIETQKLLRKYFNFVLECYRTKLDSEFLTTYKYSNAEYTRKYLGLNQVRKLIETFPYKMDTSNERNLNIAINECRFREVLNILKKNSM